jgi:pimeloyl-ACP methyl ester carboxylesterase
MPYFSGFCLEGEEELFAPYYEERDFCVGGFSLGAIEAFEYACHAQERIDKLQLFSPAFFEDRDQKFKRLQELYFQKDKKSYVENFLENIASPSTLDMKPYYHDRDDAHALHKLLNFTWSREKLEGLLERSIMIELYLGERDKIIDAQRVREFFQPYATIYWMKGCGHILKERDG